MRLAVHPCTLTMPGPVRMPQRSCSRRAGVMNETGVHFAGRTLTPPGATAPRGCASSAARVGAARKTNAPDVIGPAEKNMVKLHRVSVLKQMFNCAEPARLFKAVAYQHRERQAVQHHGCGDAGRRLHGSVLELRRNLRVIAARPRTRSRLWWTGRSGAQAYEKRRRAAGQLHMQLHMRPWNRR
jgi:hypothetical protein